eukprot:1698582-Lingulodinium_polyedra.AAC.1
MTWVGRPRDDGEGVAHRSGAHGSLPKCRSPSHEGGSVQPGGRVQPGEVGGRVERVRGPRVVGPDRHATE